MPYRSDLTPHPIVLMIAHGRLERHDWSRMFDDLEALLARGQTFAVLLDAREAGLPDFGDMRDCASFLREREPLLARWHRGIACVTPSPMIRGLLKGVVQLSAMPMPVAMFEDGASAHAWLCERLGLDPSKRDIVLDDRIDAVGPSR